MARQMLTADAWISDSVTVRISENTDLGTLSLRHHDQPLLTFFADNGNDRTRLADLIVLRNLARRMLVACEEALAADRAKAEVDPLADVSLPTDGLPPNVPVVDLMANLEASLAAAREAKSEVRP